MRTVMHNHIFNLFKENRVVFISLHPSQAPERAENAESASKALKKLTPDEASDAAKTAIDTTGRLAKVIE
ncbi:hypothetical protein J7J83_03520, partial [bacterium]|nr:hypothetical protein [bacterium]